MNADWIARFMFGSPDCARSKIARKRGQRSSARGAACGAVGTSRASRASGLGEARARSSTTL
eukprot:6536064-Prymnesium_polylepis.1